MENSTFHEQLSRLYEVFPNTESVSIPQAARFYSCDPRTLRADRTSPAKKIGSRMNVSIINFARWLAV